MLHGIDSIRGRLWGGMVNWSSQMDSVHRFLKILGKFHSAIWRILLRPLWTKGLRQGEASNNTWMPVSLCIKPVHTCICFKLGSCYLIIGWMPVLVGGSSLRQVEVLCLSLLSAFSEGYGIVLKFNELWWPICFFLQCLYQARVFCFKKRRMTCGLRCINMALCFLSVCPVGWTRASVISC